MTRLSLLCLFGLLCLLPAFPAGAKALDVRTITSPGGIEAWLVEDRTVPVVSVSFSFAGGLAYDPEDKPGTGRLVSILLDEGAGGVGAQDFQTRLADKAIGLSFSAGRDAFAGRLKTLRENREEAFGLLALALTRPRFDADAVARMKNANVAQIRNDMGDPSWLVARCFNGMLFENHAYARPGHGHLASMEAIGRGDLLRFVRRQFARDVLKVSIAGDISAEEAGAALDLMFGALPAAADPVETPDVSPAHAGKTILLPLDTPQTFIAAGQEGLRRKDPDWHAAVIMNYILGGGSFEARLMKEIREKRGLTYGIYTALGSMDHASVLQVNTSTANEKAGEVIALIGEEWRRMAVTGPTVREVEDAKSYLTGSLLLELTSTADISDALNGLQRDGLEPDYINTRNAALAAVTPADVRRVAARVLKDDALTFVLVGQPTDVEADILLDRPPGMKEPGKK